jgi:hypothetical protein
MLRDEDQTLDFTSKETLIGGIRSQREQRRDNHEDTGREQVFNTVVGTTAPSTDRSNRRTEESGRGNDEEVANSDGRGGGFGQDVGDIIERNARGYSGTHQPVQPSEQRRSRFSGVRDTARKYRDALREERRQEEKKKKPEGRKLTDAEAIRIRPALIEYVLWQSEHMDQVIVATTTGHDPNIEIGSSITEPEAEILVDFFISQAKVYPKVAQAVRLASVAIERLKVGIIVMPRVYQTINLYFTRGFTLH